MADVMATRERTQVLTAKSIMSDKVTNQQGENLGDIKDLMMDINKGCITYAVLDFGGFLGIGSKYFAVPWHQFTVNEDERTLMLDVSKDQLEQSPGFDKDRWPQSNDDYYSQVDRYYGGMGASGMGQGGTGTMGRGTGSGMGGTGTGSGMGGSY